MLYEIRCCWLPQQKLWLGNACVCMDRILLLQLPYSYARCVFGGVRKHFRVCAFLYLTEYIYLYIYLYRGGFDCVCDVQTHSWIDPVFTVWSWTHVYMYWCYCSHFVNGFPFFALNIFFCMLRKLDLYSATAIMIAPLNTDCLTGCVAEYGTHCALWVENWCLC